MPHKFYHGKTGVVWNVTPRAIGVQVNKLIGNRIIRKRLHVRIEHVKHSTCRQEFLDRVKVNDQRKLAAKAEGKRVVIKRKPAQPRAGGNITSNKGKNVQTLHPLAYLGLYQ